MKGLLLKDFYQAAKYCRSYLLICLGFMGISLIDPSSNNFFLVYPCVMASMIPVNLIAYDTSSRWEVMSLTMPYSRTQLVSAKYLVGLLCEIGVILLTALCYGLKMGTTGSFSVTELGELAVTLVCLTLLLPALMLPLVFKLGVEKGRIFYLCSVGAIAAAFALVGTGQLQWEISLPPFALPLVTIVLYILSWRLSIRFYEKRDF